jgi:CBS domain-containing protein
MKTVEDILMAKGSEVIVSAPTETVLDAARLMAEARVGSVVIRQGSQVVGLFTEQDLLRRVVAAGKEPAAIRLADMMSSPVQTCRLGDDLQDCVSRMSEQKIRHLVVVEQDALVGMISLRDILLASRGKP